MTPISVDVGVLERSDRVLVLAGDFGWDDVGTWGALRRVRAATTRATRSSGHVYAVDAHDNVVHARERDVVLYGVSDLVVVVEGRARARDDGRQVERSEDAHRRAAARRARARMSALYLYDDARAREFEPFALTRPIAEMVAGRRLQRERWQTALQCRSPA